MGTTEERLGGAWAGSLQIGSGWAHYRGRAGDTALHAHYAVQLVFTAAERDCQVRFENGQCETGRFIYIPSHVTHQLTAAAAPFDVLFVEPTLLRFDGELHAARGSSLEGLEVWIDEIRSRQSRAVDPRIQEALKTIDRTLEDKINLAALAQHVSLSSSRFAELFRQGTGLALRPYVLWRRVRRAVLATGEGATATQAAHMAGFSDSAHFARTLKRMFGITHSTGLAQLDIRESGH